MATGLVRGDPRKSRRDCRRVGAGLGGTGIDRGFVCAHDLGFRAYLSELIVARGVRGRGIGKSLVERVQAELARRECRILIADVWHNAEPFYRSLGWEPPDVVLLRRKLDRGAG